MVLCAHLLEDAVALCLLRIKVCNCLAGSAYECVATGIHVFLSMAFLIF